MNRSAPAAPPAGPLTPERLLCEHFLPHYPPDVRADPVARRAEDANPAENPLFEQTIREAADLFVRLAPAELDAPDLLLDYSDASVHRLGAALTLAGRDRVLARGLDGSAARGEPPPLVPLVLHGTFYVGECVVRNHGGRWRVRRPLWESLVALRTRAGDVELPLFHWWLKALSDAEIGEGRLGDRYRLHVEVPTMRPETLPPLCPADRRIPRLARVRYDTLHRHLRAHLPELRDLGEAFPSPERFAELGFEWLEFVLVGEGRMLVVHGPGATGIHLVWLDASGFQKALYLPADAAPPHTLHVEGDKLVVKVPVLGAPRRHEMLWWGP